MKTKKCLRLAALGMLAVVPCFTACTTDGDGGLHSLEEVGKYSMKMTLVAPTGANGYFDTDVDSRIAPLSQAIQNNLGTNEFNEEFDNTGYVLSKYRTNLEAAKSYCQPLLDSLVGVTGSNDVYIACWAKSGDKNEYYPDASKFLSHDTIRPTQTVESLNLIGVYEYATTNAVKEKSFDDAAELIYNLETKCSAKMHYFRNNSIQKGFDDFCSKVTTYKYVVDYLKKLPDSVYIELQFRDRSKTATSGNVIKRADGTELRKRYYKSDL